MKKDYNATKLSESENQTKAQEELHVESDMKPDVSVTGKWEQTTTEKAEDVFRTEKVGIIKNQRYTDKRFLEQAYSSGWEFKTENFEEGSELVRAIQRRVNADVSGYFDCKTIEKLQVFLKIDDTGILDHTTVKAFQRWLNQQ